MNEDLRAKSKLWILVLGHFLGGIALTVSGNLLEVRYADLDFVPRVPAFALILAQTCLIGLWAAMSDQAWWLRLLGLGLSIAYLELQLVFASDDDDFATLVTVATLTLAFVLWLIRICKADVRSLADPTARREGLQFSIRGLMLFTLVVAVLITLAKHLRQQVHGPKVWVMSIWGLCFVVANLAAIWAMLGLARPRSRSAVVVMISVALGALFGYIIDEGVEAYFYIITIMALHTLFLLGSLAVLRGEGYRFISRTPHGGATP